MRFKDLAWTAFLAYYISAKDEDYQEVMGSGIVKSLRSNPRKVSLPDYRRLIVQKYLNTWGSCQVRFIPYVARQVRDGLTNAIRDYRMVVDESLLASDFNDPELRANIAEMYDRLHRRKRIGPTITSKIMHLMNPSLFLPWDKFMRRDFCKENGIPKTKDDVETYIRFMVRQQGHAREVTEDFSRRYRKKARMGPASYLSHQLGYRPGKKLTKFIDEYNWIILSHMRDKSLIPPPWIPDN